MTSLRTRLTLVFLCGTLVPFAATVGVSLSLLQQSFRWTAAPELDELSLSLQQTGRELYQHARAELRSAADSGSTPSLRFSATQQAGWPEDVRDFWSSAAPEQFQVTGDRGNELSLLLRDAQGVRLYRRSLGAVHLNEVSQQYSRARATLAKLQEGRFRRGFTVTLLVLVAGVWLASFMALTYVADRVTRPMRELTAALMALERGDLSVRVQPTGADEVGQAMQAFNSMTQQLAQSREQLTYFVRLSSWQALGRKMAHELKNALTPIRLTVEEMVARSEHQDRAFLDQASQIVIDEVDTLERRVRAFTDLAAEPPVIWEHLDLAALVRERLSLLRPAYPGVRMRVEGADEACWAYADADLAKAVLNNLLENAAQAVGRDGSVVVRLANDGGRAIVEVHDDGPGLSAQARGTLFEPSISFKRSGMGLGLSIARKSALLCKGDVLLIEGELGGAGFQVRFLPGVPRPAPQPAPAEECRV